MAAANGISGRQYINVENNSNESMAKIISRHISSISQKRGAGMRVMAASASAGVMAWRKRNGENAESVIIMKYLAYRKYGLENNGHQRKAGENISVIAAARMCSVAWQWHGVIGVSGMAKW